MNILIPPDLKRDLRIRGAELGISMAEAARRAIEDWLERTKAKVPA